MKSRLLWLAIVVSCATGPILALAQYGWHRLSTSASVDVPVTEVEIGECAAGQKREIILKFNNQSSVPVRVIGVAGS
jgi:hypothetical protein